VLRRFRPPAGAQVWLDANGRPVRIASAKTTGRVVACAGPWRCSGDWWSAHPWDRCEWDIEMAGGGLYRIYQDWRGQPDDPSGSKARVATGPEGPAAWFVNGYYD
jgi:protein ImuB